MNDENIFDKTYRDYLAQVALIDLNPLPQALGIEIVPNAAIVHLFGKRYKIAHNSIADEEGNRPPHSVSVVLCKYLLMAPMTKPQGIELTTYREFKDAAPFVGGFITNAEKPIAKAFSGKLDALATAAKELGGVDPGLGLPFQLVRRFEPLPKLPLVLLFNDEDEEFPADARILFEARAEVYLDMECLALLGWLLSDNLKRIAFGESMSIM